MAKRRGKKADGPETHQSPEDRDTDWYRTQIRYLTEELDRSRLRCEELQRQEEDVSCQHRALRQENKDIMEYLKRSVLEKEDEVDELTERLESQRKAAEDDQDALRLQHSQLTQQLQDRINELTTENATLVGSLASLGEFKEQKEQLMSNMASVEQQLLRQEEEHKAELHRVEMKALLDQRRLEQDMQSRTAAMAAGVQQLVDQKVPETTQRALQENTQVKARFGQLSEQTRVLMEENSVLRGRKSRLSVDVDILEQMLSEMSRQSCVRKKVAERLTDRCQRLQAALADARRELEQLQAKHAGLQAEMEALRQDGASLSQQGSSCRAAVSRLEEELQEERRRSSTMKSIMQEAAVAVREALMEAPPKVPGGGFVVQWKQLMQRLLPVLDRPTGTRCDPAAAASPGTLNPASSFRFELARYRPGDLGLVPPPTVKHKYTLPRMGNGSSGTHLPLHRRPRPPDTPTDDPRKACGLRRGSGPET